MSRRGRPQSRGTLPAAPADRELFVDTGAWFALQVPDDRWHQAATETLRLAVEGGYELATTNHVVGETYTLLTCTHGTRVARQFVSTLSKSSRVRVSHVGPEVEVRAWEILGRFDDQKFSFVDGTSFAMMKDQGIVRAFAFDKHFRAAGFVRVPVDEAL